MKYGLGLVIGLLAANSFAQSGQVQFMAGVQDRSAAVARWIEGNQASLSGKQQFCWLASNLPPMAHNVVTETMYSPDSLTISGVGLQITRLNQGRTHIVTSTRKLNQNGVVDGCWQFDNTDPLGVYRLEVKVNGLAFPMQQFELVK